MTFRGAPVPGGELSVGVQPGATAPVSAIHGVSSYCQLWNWLRAEAPDLALVAPDLRGRGGSVAVAGPSSVARHAEDRVAVLDALGLDRVAVCGMSMGGFVAVALATVHPDRVRALVLVDGGFPMARPEGLTEDGVRAAFAPQAARSTRTFADVGEYADLILAGSPLLDRDDPLLLDYLTHDLADGRVRLDPEALLADAVDTQLGPSRWRELDRPTWFLHAEWSVGANRAAGVPAGAGCRFRRGAARPAVHRAPVGRRPRGQHHDPARRRGGGRDHARRAREPAPGRDRQRPP